MVDDETGKQEEEVHPVGAPIEWTGDLKIDAGVIGHDRNSRDCPADL
jgi:hypothetical protein